MNLLRFVMLLGALMAYCYTWGQTGRPKSQIAALATDTQVLALVRPFGWEFEQLVLGDSARSVYQPYARTAFRWQGKTWHRADLDGNGWLDLLVVGRRRDIPFVFCVLDSGNNRLRIVRNFYSALDERQPMARVVQKKGKSLLQYTSFARRRGASGELTGRRTLLLAYKGGGFIPYERQPTTHRIRSLTYTSRLYYHGQHDIQVAIDSTGLARYSYRSAATGDTTVPTKYRQQQLRPDQQAEVAELLNYVRFASCSSRYGTGNENHRPRVTLSVTYEGGLKTIHDSSGGGTLGLAQVYNWLEALATPLTGVKEN
ncbi:hypothetical protein E4631_24595 [Hymenobacter sp. UV11]|uniref:hypothetical protein n=1 Tax=Hymenobacter sp. UV11 TaxID=1849735 RepID=UPI0010767659|nr:hypothetical protein [Hymenobacter sp. UV11]TDN36832.1 hypothetical protein A8B98_07020 [Hymenobacter sp. UV11]TFZ62736.1 hypothetical protein E4631_24595 [Hymenobacter sp. UV11]